MKTQLATLVLLVAAFTLESCDQQGATPEQLAAFNQLQSRVQDLESESVIRHKLQTYMVLLQNADWDNYIKYFSETAKLVMTEGTVTGREGIKNRMANATARYAKAAEGKPVLKRVDLVTNVEVEVHGDKANAKTRFNFLAETGQGGFEIAGSGLYIDEWIKESGEWVIASRTVDYDMLKSLAARVDPPAAPAAAKAPAKTPVKVQTKGK